MKVFAYDPTTGKKGAFIENVPCVTWSGKFVSPMIENGQLKDLGWKTMSMGANTEVKMRLEGGTGGCGDDSVNYRKEDQWVCYCEGLFTVGQTSEWHWTILPSTKALLEAGIDPKFL